MAVTRAAFLRWLRKLARYLRPQRLLSPVACQVEDASGKRAGTGRAAKISEGFIAASLIGTHTLCRICEHFRSVGYVLTDEELLALPGWLNTLISESPVLADRFFAKDPKFPIDCACAYLTVRSMRGHRIVP